MKRSELILSALLATISISCNKFQEIENECASRGDKLEKVHLRFAASDFKTILGPEDNIIWQPGDAISIYDGVENCRFETSMEGGSVFFEGDARDTGSWIAVYPYYQSTVFNGGKVSTYIKSAQYSPAGTFGRGRSLSACKVGADRKIHMKNAFGLVEFKLTSSDITSVTLQGNDSEPLAGTAEISFGQGDNLPVVKLSDSRNYVNIYPEDGKTFVPGTYYAAIAPTSFPNGINMSFTRSSDDRYAVKRSSTPTRLSRNGILPLGTVDSNLTWEETDIRKIEIEFRNSSKSFWPFSYPEDVSSSSQSPSFPGAVTTFVLDEEHGGYQMDVYAQNGVFRVGSGNQGFKIMGGENDYILFPSLPSRRLSAVELRSGYPGFMRYPSIRTQDGGRTVCGGEIISGAFSAEGDSYRWNLYDTQYDTRYRLCFNVEGKNVNGADAARLQKITLYYSALPGGDPREEPEVSGLTEDAVPDFSRVGYHFGDDEIPHYPVSRTLTAPTGTLTTAKDASAMIQSALDEAAEHSAVLLKAGTYYLDNPINLRKSGVVLRGEGNSTVLLARVLTPSGDSTGIVKNPDFTLPDSRIIRFGTLKSTSNSRVLRYSTAQRIIRDAYCSQMFVCVADASGFAVGDRVYIFRPGTGKWIHDLHMDQIYPNGGETVQWVPSEYDMGWERTVMAIDGSKLYFDNPLVMSITEEYGGGYVMQCSYDRIRESGVEDLVLDSAYDPGKVDDSSKYDGKWGTYCCDENHCWHGIMVYGAEHCWVSGVSARHMAGSCVNMLSGSRNITVRNCSSQDPVSMIQGSRRYAFHFSRAELCLVRDCIVSRDRHAFVTGARCCGPNVFLRCSARNMYEDVGPHQRWATGCLYDNVSTDYWFTVQDRADAGSGHGWAGANFVLWNCDVVARTDGLVPYAGRRIAVQSPWVSAKCWAFGCTGEKVGTTRNYKETPSLGPRPDGVWTNFGTHMSNPSLYEKQLQDRRDAGIRIVDGGDQIESYLRSSDEYLFN